MWCNFDLFSTREASLSHILRLPWLGAFCSEVLLDYFIQAPQCLWVGEGGVSPAGAKVLPRLNCLLRLSPLSVVAYFVFQWRSSLKLNRKEYFCSWPLDISGALICPSCGWYLAYPMMSEGLQLIRGRNVRILVTFCS